MAKKYLYDNLSESSTNSGDVILPRTIQAFNDIKPDIKPDSISSEIYEMDLESIDISSEDFQALDSYLYGDDFCNSSIENYGNPVSTKSQCSGWLYIL